MDRPKSADVTLSTAQIDEACQALIALRQAGQRMDAPTADLIPPTLADAYAVQDAVRTAWGQPLGGWKIGATAPPVQAKFGISEPFAGPFFQPDVWPSPARAPALAFPHGCIESEFAFRFAARLPPRATLYSRAEIVAAIDALVPAIELVGTRFATLLFDHVTTAVADCALNAGFVFGAPVENWSSLDLASHPVCLRVDGAVVAEGTGANVLGHPLAVLDWAVNHLSQRGIAIEPGHVISTGTTTGLVVVEPGQTAIADFGVLGKVEVTLYA